MKNMKEMVMMVVVAVVAAGGIYVVAQKMMHKQDVKVQSMRNDGTGQVHGENGVESETHQPDQNESPSDGSKAMKRTKKIFKKPADQDDQAAK